MTEIVDVVLDVELLDDGSSRVLVQGVFPQHAEHPPARAGRTRNVVSCFLGRDMRDVSAFRIWPDTVRPAP
jgi:hypothetical protein